MKSDTNPQINKILDEKFRALSGEERVEMATSMFETARAIMIDSLKNQNPAITENEIHQELFRRLYGENPRD